MLMLKVGLGRLELASMGRLECHAKFGPIQKRSTGPKLAANSPGCQFGSGGPFLAAKFGPTGDYFWLPNWVLHTADCIGRVIDCIAELLTVLAELLTVLASLGKLVSNV